VKASPGIVLAGTAAGFVGVIFLHSMSVLGSPAQTGSAAPVGVGPRTPGPSASAGGLRSPGAQPTGHGATSGAAGSGNGGAPRTATGTRVSFGYGSLAIRVTVRGSRIANLAVAALQTLEPTSQTISEQAIPVLRSEVLAAQSANVQAVSGASYTSTAYVQSLQAALDALHVR
jgi:hypothetical protein